MNVSLEGTVPRLRDCGSYLVLHWWPPSPLNVVPGSDRCRPCPHWTRTPGFPQSSEERSTWEETSGPGGRCCCCSRCPPDTWTEPVGGVGKDTQIHIIKVKYSISSVLHIYVVGGYNLQSHDRSKEDLKKNLFNNFLLAANHSGRNVHPHILIPDSVVKSHFKDTIYRTVVFSSLLFIV